MPTNNACGLSVWIVTSFVLVAGMIGEAGAETANSILLCLVFIRNGFSKACVGAVVIVASRFVVDREFVAVGNESRGATDRKQWYVSLSRAREMAKVYVDSKEDVRNAIARGTERMSAVELTQTRIRENWRARVRKTLERNRVARFLKDRTDAVADYWNRQKRGRSLGYGRG